jgi:hypothetical protein
LPVRNAGTQIEIEDKQTAGHLVLDASCSGGWVLARQVQPDLHLLSDFINPGS